jgi:hypothetical protein
MLIFGVMNNTYNYKTQFGLHTSISIDKIMNIKSLHYAKGRQFQNIGTVRCEIDTCLALLCIEKEVYVVVYKTTTPYK